MSVWKITSAERRAIRAYAAHSEKVKPGAITLSIAERYNTEEGNSARRSTNIYLVDDTPDWEESDLFDKWSFTETKAVPLDPQGRALIDLYVYDRTDFGELLTNVQAYAETVDGKPMLVKMTGTGSRSIGRTEIKELMGP